MPHFPKHEILVAARESPLSQAQIKEIDEEIRYYHPHLVLVPLLMKTQGDLDLTISLRNLDKTDFFTREIDIRVLDGTAHIGLHSAKDLPHPLPKGLTLIALTQGKNPADALVFRSGETLKSLPTGSKIATSSKRREDCVKSLRSDFDFVDIRGTIEQRLQQLELKKVDAIVIAEAALIRLNLTHLNRMILPGDTVEGQGQLAVLAKTENQLMAELFSCIDSRCLAKL